MICRCVLSLLFRLGCCLVFWQGSIGVTGVAPCMGAAIVPQFRLLVGGQARPRGGSRGRGGQDPPPPPFGGPLNFIKRGGNVAHMGILVTCDRGFS